MMDKEYFKTYYKNHKEKYLKRDKEWAKDNPDKVKAMKKKYRDKVKEEGEKHTNQSSYGKTSPKLIERYGKDLEKTKDNVTLIKHKKRMFCMDCIYYRRGRILKGCPGWDRCPYKEEILEEINKAE